MSDTPRTDDFESAMRGPADAVLVDALDHARTLERELAEALGQKADALRMEQEWCKHARENTAYAVALEAPAGELLFLYDWRPDLAKMEDAARDENGGNAFDRKQVAALLREYGERKKAGWIALRAALAKNPTSTDLRGGGAESRQQDHADQRVESPPNDVPHTGDTGPGKASDGGQSPELGLQVLKTYSEPVPVGGVRVGGCSACNKGQVNVQFDGKTVTLLCDTCGSETADGVVMRINNALRVQGEVAHDWTCRRCAGAGSIPFIKGRGDFGEEFDAECPDCGGTGVVGEARQEGVAFAPTPKGDGQLCPHRIGHIKCSKPIGHPGYHESYTSLREPGHKWLPLEPPAEAHATGGSECTR